MFSLNSGRLIYYTLLFTLQTHHLFPANPWAGIYSWKVVIMGESMMSYLNDLKLNSSSKSIYQDQGGQLTFGLLQDNIHLKISHFRNTVLNDRRFK